VVATAYSTASSELLGVAGGAIRTREPLAVLRMSSPEVGRRRIVPANGLVVAKLYVPPSRLLSTLPPVSV
jgi:hypothetical protein